MGVWIEIPITPITFAIFFVTPCVGVWIEMVTVCKRQAVFLSLPAWECGLKFLYFLRKVYFRRVTPCVGVWIEIHDELSKILSYNCHSLRGSVD